MIAMILVGGGVGAGLAALLWIVAPPRVSQAVALGRFDALHTREDTHTAAEAGRGGREGAVALVGAWVTELLRKRGVQLNTVAQDAALTGSTVSRVMGVKVVTAVGFFLAALAVLVAVVTVGGWSLPPGAPLVLAAAAGAGGYVTADIDVRQRGNKRRRDFRRGLAAWMDLVSLEMAAAAAPAEALPKAAAVGTGWPFLAIRDTLARSVLSGQGQWEALTGLGRRIGVPELVELGDLLRLVAADGARVRATLSARAASMRAAELAETQGVAGKRDDSMRLAQIVIAVGFMVFLGYPAIAALSAV